MMSDIQEQDSEEEAGSMDVSQLDRDVSRTEDPKPIRRSKSSMENVLGTLASKTNLEEEVKQAQFKQEDELPKVPGLSQSVSTPFNPRKVTAEQEAETLSTGTELKKPGFAKLYDKGNKEDASKGPVRPNARLGGGEPKNVLQENNPVRNEEPPHMKTSGQNGVSEGADPREMQRLKDELAKEQGELNRMNNALEDLREENEQLKADGKG